jgi:hypothetical protein
MAQNVEGTAANATPPTGAPVLMAGWDGTNTYTLKTDNQGQIVLSSSAGLPSTIYNGKTTVATAGTRVALASSQAISNSVTIRALKANTGTIYVGNSSVASTNGLALSAGDSVTVVVANLNTVNLDCSVNGEGVTYLAT